MGIGCAERLDLGILYLAEAYRRVQGHLVMNMRYLASVVTQCFQAFGELLALQQHFVELSGGITRCAPGPCCTLPQAIWCKIQATALCSLRLT